MCSDFGWNVGVKEYVIESVKDLPRKLSLVANVIKVMKTLETFMEMRETDLILS